MVAACVLPVEEVAGTNISVVAKSVFPAPIYLFFVIGGAWFALLTTLNGTLSWTTRSLHRAAKDGWLPEFCAKENKNGVPVVLLLFFFVVGVIPIVTGMDTADISNMGTGCSKLADLLMVYACFRLPTMFPEEYKKSALYIAPKEAECSTGSGIRCIGSNLLCEPVRTFCKAVYVLRYLYRGSIHFNDGKI